MFGEGVHTMFSQFVVKVVLLNLLVDVGLKGKAATFCVEPVGLKVLQDLVLHRCSHCLAKEVCIKGPVSLTAILGLEVLLCVGPCWRFSPVTLEDLEDSGIVCMLRLGPEFGFIEGLKVGEMCHSLRFSFRIGAQRVNSSSIKV